MDSRLPLCRHNRHSEAALAAAGAKGSRITLRYVLRLLCVTCSVLLAAACKPSAAAKYTPPIIPVTFSISSDWHVSVTVGAKITTFLGTFSLDGEVSAPLASDSTRVSIILQQVGQKQVYDLQGQGTVTLCLNGQIEETISQHSVVVTALNAPSEINLLPGDASSCPAASPVSASSAPVPSKSQHTESRTQPTGASGGALPVGSWRPVGGASVVSRGGGVFEATYGPTFWGGLYASSDAGCNYRFSGSARVISGGGYGLTVWASVDSGGTPHGQSMQYDMGASGYRNVALPDGSENGPVQPGTVDNNWHTVSVEVYGGRYVELVDGTVVFGGHMPGPCTSGVFIRLWNSADVEFKNLTVTRI